MARPFWFDRDRSVLIDPFLVRLPAVAGSDRLNSIKRIAQREPLDSQRLWHQDHELGNFPVVPYDQPVEDEFEPLCSIRIGTQDRKLAAIVLANQLMLVTRNRRVFARAPGLTLEDWSV
jgi:hypothetical protein